MADFEETLNGITSGLGEDSDLTPYDDLRAAYTERVGAGDAKVAELEGSLADKDAEIGRLKAHNYDLLTAVERGNKPGVLGQIEDSASGDGTDTVSLGDIITYS